MRGQCEGVWREKYFSLHDFNGITTSPPLSLSLSPPPPPSSMHVFSDKKQFFLQNILFLNSTNLLDEVKNEVFFSAQSVGAGVGGKIHKMLTIFRRIFSKVVTHICSKAPPLRLSSPKIVFFLPELQIDRIHIFWSGPVLSE